MLPGMMPQVSAVHVPEDCAIGAIKSMTLLAWQITSLVLQYIRGAVMFVYRHLASKTGCTPASRKLAAVLHMVRLAAPLCISAFVISQ